MQPSFASYDIQQHKLNARVELIERKSSTMLKVVLVESSVCAIIFSAYAW